MWMFSDGFLLRIIQADPSEIIVRGAMTESAHSKMEIALVGFGAIAELGHWPALAKLHESARVVAVVDHDPHRRAAAAKATGLHKRNLFESVGDLVSTGLPADLVIVMLPASSAPCSITELVGAGYQVLTEKPIAGDVESALSVLRNANAADAVRVVHNYLYRTDVRAAFSALTAHDLGPVRLIRFERPDKGYFPGRGIDPAWRKRTDAGGGCLRDNAYHWFYIAEKFAGAPISSISAMTGGRPAEAEDVAIIALEHSSGTLTNIVTAWCAKKAEEVLEVHTEDASLRLDGDGGGCHLYWNSRHIELGAAPRGQSSYQRMYREVLQGFRDGYRSGATLEEAIRIIAIFQACYLAQPHIGLKDIEDVLSGARYEGIRRD